jgi:hypothetical protein
MKLVSYAAQQLVTTDDVAEVLVTLAAAIANEGESEALEIPIVVDGRIETAELIVGLGNDLLVGPSASTDVDPDFSEQAAALRAHHRYPRSHDGESGDDDWNITAVDLDLDIRP